MSPKKQQKVRRKAVKMSRHDVGPGSIVVESPGTLILVHAYPDPKGAGEMTFYDGREEAE